MPQFTYTAKDNSGKTVAGQVDAADSRSAAGMVREMGYWPLDVRQDGHPSAQPAVPSSVRAATNPVWTGVSTKYMAVFFRQLATMLSSGMILSECLDGLGKQRLGKLAEISLRGADHVRSGGLFSDVMAANPRIFTPAQIGLFRAGETGGRLDAMVEKSAEYVEKELALRQKFSRATFYPKILLVFCFLFAVFFPHLVELVTGNTGKTSVYVLLHEIVPVLAVALAAFVLAKMLLTLRPVRRGWDRFKLVFPVLGSASGKLAMARMSTSISVMYSAGVPFSEAIAVAADASGNEVIRQSMMRSIPEVQAGGQLTDALKRTGQMPDLVLSMISTGERTGNLGGTLDKVAEYYEDEAVTTLEKTSHILFVLLIVLIGAWIGYTVIKFWSGYFNGLLGPGGAG